VKHAVVTHPNLAGRVSVGQLPELQEKPDADFDAVLCSAVLMHVPEEQLFDAAFGIRRVLKPNGRLLLSLPVESTIDPSTRRDASGRLFSGLTAERCQLLFERLGFNLAQRWDNPDSLGRPERTWASLLFVLQSDDGKRSIDRIEMVLNKDRKVATYKLALFRALAELAMTNYNLAIWRIDGKVLLPLNAVAEKWIEYYWPIFESDNLVPQIQAENPDNAHQRVAFRPLLTELVDAYTGRGSLTRYVLESRNGSLPEEIVRLQKQVFAKTASTIRAGPVTHAGGAGTETTVFEYDKRTKCIVMDADLWRELSLMGTWVRDATILRWAELTAHLSQDQLKPSQVVDLLLTEPLPEREVNDARSLYLKMPGKRCVWTDRSLTGTGFEVDHTIPFALWHNNDLWNLLPACRAANNQKRDKLPTRNLLHARKDAVVAYWEALREAHTVRFEREAVNFGGSR